MQETNAVPIRSRGLLVRQRATCILAYGFIWAYTFNLLWFLESNGVEYLRHFKYIEHAWLPITWNILCPEWPFFAFGLILGLVVCVSLTKTGNAVKSGLLCGLLPAIGIFVLFGFTTSGLLPALLAVAAAYFAAAIVARTWPSLFLALPRDRPLSPKKLIVTLIWLFVLGFPFRLLGLIEEGWSQEWHAEISETDATISPNGAYIATIHNVNPGAAGDYSDVIIRPRQTIFDLFCNYSASAEYEGIDHIQWTGQHTLTIWRNYDAAQEQWHDLRIIYKDTRGSAEKKQDDAAKQ